MGYQQVTVAPTITAGAYSAGDVIGGVMEIPVNSYSGIIRQVNVDDDDNEKAEITLYFFNAAPTAILDNAAFAPAIADLKKLVGVLVVATANYTTVNSNAWAAKAAVDIEYALAESGVPKLYCYGVVTATPTYTATSDLQFRFIIEPK
jgi:hypothetical protein